MNFQRLIHLIILLLMLFTLSGCTFIRMGQEGAEKIKTTSTHGYQNGIEPDAIRNVKDYIANENDFVILAETSNTTLYKTRNESNFGRLSILDDLIDYCTDIQGKVQFGKQFGASIAREYDSLDFEFSTIKEDYKKNRLHGYAGWMKCIDSNDDFEVLRKSRTKYFVITHKEPQLQGYALQWYIDYFDLDKLDIKTLNIGVWSYSSMIQLAGVCEYHKGKALISNAYTKHKKMLFNDYLLQQFDPLVDTKGYVLSAGSFSCQESEEGRSDVNYDINYSKQYRQLLYTKLK